MYKETATLNYRWKVTRPPEGQLFRLSELKALLRITNDAEDAYLYSLIDVATEQAEAYTKRCYLLRGITLYLDVWGQPLPIWDGWREGDYWGLGWAPRELVLPCAPLNTTTNAPVVTIIDEDDAQTVYDASNYIVDDKDNDQRGRLILRQDATYPSLGNVRIAQGVEIQFDAGYGTAADVPAALRLGAMQWAAALYRNRGDCQLGSSGGCGCGYAVTAETTLRMWRIMDV